MIRTSETLYRRSPRTTSLSSSGARQRGQWRKSRPLFDHLVAIGQRLDAIIIQAARLTAILPRIAQVDSLVRC
jgi:hypothetical protein